MGDNLYIYIYTEKKNIKTLATIMFIIFWDFLMTEQILPSPQVKRSVTISNKIVPHELPHEFSNNLRLRKDLRS